MELGWLLGDGTACPCGGPNLVLLQPALTPCSLLLLGSRVLQLPRLQLSSSGTYTCVALNVAGRAEKRFILTVHGKRRGLGQELWPRACTDDLMANTSLRVPAHTPHPRSSSSEPPGIQDPEQEVLDADMGTPLVLTCQITGVPVPAITWLKDGNPLGMSVGGCCAGLPCRALVLPHLKQSCLSFPISHPAARDPQGLTGEKAEHEGAGIFPACF